MQLITNITRTWKGQVDSILDQIWTNAMDIIAQHGNHVRASSDHNVIYVHIATSNISSEGHITRRRSWTKFNGDRFDEEIKQVDWTSLYETGNVNVANSIFEEKLRKILDKEAPMQNIQQRTKSKVAH